MAERAASLGYHVLRFDHVGSGDASGSAEPFRLADPRVDLLSAAAEHLRQVGVSQHVVVGSCHGGRAALAAAQTITSVVGISAESLAVRELPELRAGGGTPTRRTFLPRRPQSRLYTPDQVAREMAGLLDRGGSVQLVFGKPDHVHKAFRSAPEFADQLAAPNAEVVVLPQALHGFPNLCGQRHYLDAVTDWLGRLPDRVR